MAEKAWSINNLLYGFWGFFFAFLGELAYHGHRVKVYDRSRQALERASNVLEEHKEQLRREECLITRNFVVRSILPAKTTPVTTTD